MSVSERVRERLRERPGTLAAAAIFLLAAWEIVAVMRPMSEAPADADWQRAAAAVAAERQTGDLIVFAPRWIDPLGRRWFGDQLTIDQLARMDAAPYARLWEVSIRGARAPETKDAALGKAVFEQSFGPVRVRRFDRTSPPPVVTWSLHARADVYEVAHEPHRCMKMPPGPWREHKGVTLGSELVIYAGIADVWSRRDNEAFARVRVLVDGNEVASASIGNDSGWFALPAIATTPGPHDVQFDVTLDKERGNPAKAKLDVCIAAESRQ